MKAIRFSALPMGKVTPTGGIRQEWKQGLLPYGSSLVVMPISSDVFGTLLSTADTWRGWLASSCFLCKYFLQSSSAKTHSQRRGSCDLGLHCWSSLKQELLFHGSGMLQGNPLSGFFSTENFSHVFLNVLMLPPPPPLTINS